MGSDKKLSGAPTEFSYFSVIRTFLNEVDCGVKQAIQGCMLVYLIQLH